MYIIRGFDAIMKKEIYLYKFPPGYFGQPKFSTSRDDSILLRVSDNYDIVKAYRQIVGISAGSFPNVINIVLEEIEISDPKNSRIVANAKTH